MSTIFFLLYMDFCNWNHDCICRVEKASRSYELIYIKKTERIPFRSFKDYSYVKYRLKY